MTKAQLAAEEIVATIGREYPEVHQPQQIERATEIISRHFPGDVEDTKGTLVTWPDGTQSHVPRVELDKWLARLKEALDNTYGYDTKLNSLQAVVQAIAHLNYDSRRKV